MHVLRRVGVLTVAIAGLGLLGSGVSGVAALDGDLQKAVQTQQREQHRTLMVSDCPKDRDGGRAHDAAASRIPS